MLEAKYGIHWQNCLAGYWAGSTGGLLWRDTGRDTGRDPLAELFGGILGGPLADSSGGILGGIHWRTTLAGYWAASTGGPLWRDTGRDALGGRTTLAGCWAGFTGGLLWRDTGRDPLADPSGGILGRILSGRRVWCSSIANMDST